VQLSNCLTNTDDAMLCVLDYVVGVTQLRDVVYIACQWSSTVRRYNAITQQQLTDLSIKDMRDPSDIASCEQTSCVYVVDSKCIWRVSADGSDIKRWLSKPQSETLTPWKLSVTSSRVLVTSDDTRQLIQFDEGGKEMRRVRLPNYMEPRHAVESPTGTFIVSIRDTQKNQQLVSEFNAEGQVLRYLSGLLPLDWTQHIAVDSRGYIFVADRESRHILLLDTQLALRRIIIDEHQLNHSYEKPQRLCYRELSGQLLVGFYRGSVTVFDVLR